MRSNCVDCGAIIDVPVNSLLGEIIGCPDCGLDFVIVQDGSGSFGIQELTIEGEDWGE